jgi:hypothetical protein
MMRIYWDNESRKVRTYDGDVLVSERDYTPDENAAADAAAASALEETNRQTIEAALDATLADLQTLISTANADINASPAAYLKTVARAERRIIRLLVRRLDGTA